MGLLRITPNALDPQECIIVLHFDSWHQCFPNLTKKFDAKDMKECATRRILARSELCVTIGYKQKSFRNCTN